MYKLNLKEIQLKTLEGQPIEGELHKVVANIMYTNAKNLDLVDLAIKLYNEGEIEVRDSELREIRELVMSSQLAAFIKKELRDYFDKLKEDSLSK